MTIMNCIIFPKLRFGYLVILIFTGKHVNNFVLPAQCHKTTTKSLFNGLQGYKIDEVYFIDKIYHSNDIV